MDFRLAMLRRLREGIEKHTEEIIAALHEDLGKSESESYMTEIGMVYAEIKEALRKTKKWSRPMKVRGTISTFPSKNFIYSEPYGVVLIISPWNYPFNLSMIPLIGAISAGNCAVIKCSRNSARTSRVIQKIINSAFDSEYVCCLDMQSNYDEVSHFLRGGGETELRSPHPFEGGCKSANALAVHRCLHGDSIGDNARAGVRFKVGEFT